MSSIVKPAGRAYLSLTIFQRINARQHRNRLNINYLFGTTVNDFNMGFTKPGEKDISYPSVNNGIYHHIGKSHSQYPKG